MWQNITLPGSRVKMYQLSVFSFYSVIAYCLCRNKSKYDFINKEVSDVKIYGSLLVFHAKTN